jgi:hypothetical protein
VLRTYLDIFVIAYLDDILVYSENNQDHIKHVKQVLRALNQFNLQLKLEKCKFYKREVLFLRYVVGVDRVRISEDKIKVVKE